MLTTAQKILLLGGSWSPKRLFAAGEQGVWYDPSDLSSMFQDSAGTTAAAFESPAGLVRDKSGRGNNASQATPTSRPTLSARYNLLTYSQAFDNAAWTKSNANVTGSAGVAPDGTTTAYKLVPSAATTAGRVSQAITGTIGVAYLFSVYAKSGEFTSGRVYIDDGGSNSVSVTYNLTTNAVTAALTVAGGNWTNASSSISDVSNGWKRITMSVTTAVAAPTRAQIWCRDTGDGTSGIYIWGADLRRSADASAAIPAYQRVNSATDYDTSGFPPYLFADGSDDGLTTGSINFSGTDKVTVIAGVYKGSDAAVGSVVELTADPTSTAGGFGALAPPSAAATYQWRGGGSDLTSAATSPGSYAAPVANVVTGIGDISGDSNILRVNGVQVASSNTDQGTGNYANAALYIGRRGGSSNPFNGRLYGLIIVGRALTAAEIAQAERWMAAKAGVSL